MYEFSWLDLTPYILMAVVLTAVIQGKGDLKKKAQINFLFLFVFAAIRYGIGYDYYGYLQSVLYQVEDYKLERYEPLSRLLLEVGHQTHYQVFFALGSFLTLFPLYMACTKLSINPAYSLLIYFLFPRYYLESFSIVRNAIAYSFVLYASVMLYDKKLIWSMVLMIVAVLFHKSAAIGILIYPLFYLKPNLKIHLILFIVSYIASNLVMSIIGDYASVIPYLGLVENYAEYARSEGGMMTYIINGLCIFHFVIWNKLVKLNSDNGKFLSLFSIGGCIWNIFLPVDSTIALRLSSFFQIFIIFLVPQYKYIFKAIEKRKFVSLCSYGFFLVLFLSYFIINANAYLKKPERMSNLPYQTIFYHKDYSNYLY